MFHMLSAIKLKTGITVEEFRQSVEAFTAHMQKIGLLHSTSPIGRRRKHPIMDTDAERDHEYYLIMSFQDRAQCDRAVENILRHEEPGKSIHQAVFSSIEDPVFTCWEDL